MTPDSFDGFFAACAGVAGALIGLLFVAISVAPERLRSETDDQAHRLRAAAALTAFTNALSVALFALIPGMGVRWPAFVLGVLGMMFVAGSLLSLLRVRGSQSVAPRDTAFLGALIVAFGLQILFALELISNGHDIGATRGIAVLVVVCFFIGIARSWELIGGPSITLTGGVIALLRARGREQERPAGGNQGSATGLDDRRGRSPR